MTDELIRQQLHELEVAKFLKEIDFDPAQIAYALLIYEDCGTLHKSIVDTLLQDEEDTDANT